MTSPNGRYITKQNDCAIEHDCKFVRDALEHQCHVTFRPVLTAVRVCVCTGLADTNINQFRRKCHSPSLIRLFVLVMRLFCRFIWSAATDLKSLAHPRPVCFIICLFHLFVQYGGQAYWLYDRYNVQVKWFMFVHFVLLIVITVGLWESVIGNHLPALWNDWMLEVPNIFWDNNVIVHPAGMTLSSISNGVIRLTAFI